MDASWDTYVSYAEQGPQLIHVDPSYRSIAPLKSHPVLVDCIIWPLPVDKFKLPASSAISLISAIETRVQLAADSRETGHYVGWISIANRTMFSYYAPDGLTMIKTFETSAKVPNGLKHKCSQEADYQWSWYQKALYPTPINLNKLENEKIRAVLRAQGDNGAMRRKVVHSAHFPSSALLEAFNTRMVDDGYQVEHRSKIPDKSGKWTIVFSQDQAPVVMDIRTWHLRTTVAELKGEYDGWESPVMLPKK